MKKLETGFENVLWSTRFIVLTAVIVSLLSSIALFYMTSVDAFYMLKHLVGYASPAMSEVMRNEIHDATITHIVEIVDGYLLASVLLIFGLGLYELFIRKIKYKYKCMVLVYPKLSLMQPRSRDWAGNCMKFV